MEKYSPPFDRQTIPEELAEGAHAQEWRASERFEIIHEDLDPSASIWRKLRRTFSPFILAGQDILGSAYAAAAQAVLERTETLQDQWAARKVLAKTISRPAPHE